MPNSTALRAWYAARMTQPSPFICLCRALAYLGTHKRDAIGASISLLLVSTANLITPQLFRLAIDRGIGQKQTGVIALAVAGILIFSVARASFSFLESYLGESASQGVAEDMRVALYTHIHHLNHTFSGRLHSGQLLTRITKDVEQIRSFVGGGVIKLTGAVILFVGCLVILIRINWKLSLITLATIPASFILLMRIGRRVGPLFGQIFQALAELNRILQEVLTGMRSVRIFCSEHKETARFAATNNRWLERNIEFLRRFTNNFPFALLLGNLATLAIIWYGGWEAMAGRLTLGELIAFYSYLSLLHFTAITMSFITTYVLGAANSSSRVFEVLDSPLDIEQLPGAYVMPTITGRVEFVDVRFRYPGDVKEILRGVSFVVEPGQMVAVVGPTGSGKSTVVDLIPRLHDVTEGSVLIDGHDVREVTLSSLRGQMGIVLQDTLLFSAPIHENIAYGRPHATREEIERAARLANAHEFISKMPNGYDTVVGPSGVNLSGGQRQRIALARAILVHPRLLILDDSTSAVDGRAETVILESLDRLMREGGHTIIVIAHRISTVRDADLILVVNEGKIVAKGTHASLLRENPLYYEILGSQMISSPEEIAGDGDNPLRRDGRGAERGVFS